MNTSHESLVLSPYIQQDLEAHIVMFWVRHRYGAYPSMSSSSYLA